MARWRLTEAHYINAKLDGDKVEWEYTEIDRTTGKQGRKRFVVQLYIEAETIVCLEGKGQRGDITIEGPPTPAMEPLDDEAEAISKEMEPQWRHPIDTLPAQGASLIGNMDANVQPIARRV